MSWLGDLFSGVTNAVSSVTNAVTGTVSGAVTHIPVVGKPIAQSVQGAGAVTNALPNALGSIASGGNVGQAVLGGVTSAAAGSVVAASTGVLVANQYIPQGVQELPILDIVNQNENAAVDIAVNKNNSSGALDNFYRSGAYIGATALTFGFGGAAIAGGETAGELAAGGATEETAATAGEVVVTDIGGETAATETLAAATETGTVGGAIPTAVGTSAESIPTAGAVATQSGSSILGTGISTGSGLADTGLGGAVIAGGVKEASPLLLKNKTLDTILSPIASAFGVDIPAQPTSGPSTAGPTRSGVTSGGSLGGSAPLSQSQQNSALILAGITIVGVLARK